MLRVLSLLVVCLAAVHARGAGRAFPIDSENYVIEAFQRINTYLEWDETNFLVDLSGQYANCDNIGRGAFLNVDKRTPDGVGIAAYVDDTAGPNSDVNAVNKYVQTVIDEWTRMYGSAIYRQIQSADRFGCSVRPGCSGRASVACLFSPGNQGDQPQPPNIEEGTPGGDQFGKALTPEQYLEAQVFTGKRWDFNHTLENLAGFETTCNLYHENAHPFPYAREQAALRGIKVEFVYGHSKNLGRTEPAMLKVLEGIKKPYGAKQVGCAIIPDCIVGNDMYVIVGCLFDTTSTYNY